MSVPNTRQRYLGWGFQPGQLLENGPFVVDATPAVAGPTPVDRNIQRPAIVEVIIDGGTDNTGDVTVRGVINGATFEEVFVFNGPGLSAIRKKGALRFSSITEWESTGLDAEGTVPTVAIRVGDHVFLDNRSESIKGNQAIIRNEGNVSTRHPTKSAAGLWEEGGDFDMIAEPENGLGESLVATYGPPNSSTPINGTAIDTGNTIATVAPTGAVSGDKRLIVDVLSLTGTGTLTITGTVNGNADSEGVPINGLGKVATVKAFDSITSYGHAGYSAIGWDLLQGDAIEHIGQPNDELPAFFLRVGKDGTVEKEITGLKIESTEWSIKTNEFVAAKSTVKGRTEEELSIQTPAFSPRAPFVFHHTRVERDDIAFDLVMEAVLKETNTLKLQDARDGTRFVCDIEVEGGKSELTMKLKFRASQGVSAHDLYRRFWGKSDATGPLAVLTEQKLKFTLTSNELIFVDGANSEPYVLEFTLHKAFIEELSEAVTGRDVIVSDAKVYLERDATEGATITWRLVNGVEAY